MNSRILFFLVSIFFLATGCGPAFLPGRTTKAVNINDITGIWEYPANFGKTTVLLELKSDGTFVQKIFKPHEKEPTIYKGNWKLDGSSLEITLLKPAFSNYSKPWIPEKVNWWVMDSAINNNRKFSICGAADDRDPDSCFEMRNLR